MRNFDKTSGIRRSSSPRPAGDHARPRPGWIGRMAVLLPFADPPMTAWGTSADGTVEVYYLKSWTGMNLDALIAKATAALPTASMTDSGQAFRLTEPDAFLLFAGD